MECLPENELIELAAGSQAGEALLHAEEHLDDCADCRFLLAELLQPDRVRAPSWDLPAGERVGRYFVLARLGIGGMGTVYAAYDPELRRKVALKLLHVRAVDVEEEAGGRLLQEAQAMARLHHPNLLAVHDVGVHGGHVFLSMELVEGESLRAYLARGPGTLEQICETFRRAGAGLQAAHRAGLVHCDVKPDNILRSPDGRIRVTDFGLARLVASADPARESTPRDATPAGHDAEPRSTGVQGSLPYMAPEQLRNLEVTPASDQFSFCVALYEAIYRERPFCGRTAAERLRAIEYAELKLPGQRSAAGPPVPTWLRSLLGRGLAVRPQDRFPSMAALLAALAPRRWVRQAATCVLLTLALGGGIAGARWVQTRPLRACESAVQRSLPRWVPAAEWQHAALWPKLARELSAYRDSWTAASTQSCRETWERQSQSAATQALRERCTLRQRFERNALLTVLSLPPAAPATTENIDAQLQRLRSVIRQLPSPERCSATRVLITQSKSLTTTSPAANHVRELLATVRIQRALGLRVPTQLSAALQLAESENDAALRAEVQLEQGLVWWELEGRSAQGIGILKEALWTAQRARDDELAATVWVRLLSAMATAARPEYAAQLRELLPHAQASVARLGGDLELTADLDALAASIGSP